MAARVERKWPLARCWNDCVAAACGGQFGDSCNRLYTELSSDPAMPLSGYLLRNESSCSHKYIYMNLQNSHSSSIHNSGLQ